MEKKIILCSYVHADLPLRQKGKGKAGVLTHKKTNLLATVVAYLTKLRESSLNLIPGFQKAHEFSRNDHKHYFLSLWFMNLLMVNTCF